MLIAWRIIAATFDTVALLLFLWYVHVASSARPERLASAFYPRRDPWTEMVRPGYHYAPPAIGAIGLMLCLYAGIRHMLAWARPDVPAVSMIAAIFATVAVSSIVDRLLSARRERDALSEELRQLRLIINRAVGGLEIDRAIAHAQVTNDSAARLAHDARVLKPIADERSIRRLRKPNTDPALR